MLILLLILISGAWCQCRKRSVWCQECKFLKIFGVTFRLLESRNLWFTQPNRAGFYNTFYFDKNLNQWVLDGNMGNVDHIRRKHKECPATNALAYMKRPQPIEGNKDCVPVKGRDAKQDAGTCLPFPTSFHDCATTFLTHNAREAAVTAHVTKVYGISYLDESGTCCAHYGGYSGRKELVVGKPQHFCFFDMYKDKTDNEADLHFKELYVVRTGKLKGVKVDVTGKTSYGNIYDCATAWKEMDTTDNKVGVLFNSRTKKCQGYTSITLLDKDDDSNYSYCYFNVDVTSMTHK